MANNLLPAATTIFFLILSVSVCVSPTLASADTDSDLVLDIEGNPLEVDSRYYILPPITIGGGLGISPRPGTGIPCPLYAIQYRSELSQGDPVTIVPVDETQKEIHLSSDVQIDSGFSAYCRDDGIWKLSLDAINRRSVFIASGAFDAPRASFKIEKTESPLGTYKITTSSPQPGEQEGSFYLTVFPDFFSRILMVGLTDDPAQAFEVVFKKYKEDVVASI